MRDGGLKPERVATLVTGSPMEPVVQRAEAVMQVRSCPKELPLVETTSERHIPRRGFTSKSRRFEDSMETDGMES